MWMEVQRRIRKEISNIKIGFLGRISSIIKDNSEVYVKMSENEEIRDIKIISPYGFYSLPNNDLIGQVIFNNSTKKPVFIGVDNKNNTPIQIDIGETIIFNSNAGTYIHLKNDGKIYIKGEIVNVQ